MKPSRRRPLISQDRVEQGVESSASQRRTISEEESLVGIRESLNKNPSITTGITIGIIVVAIVAIGWQMMSSRPNINNIKSFYTVDDGANYFEDKAVLNPPYDYKGQQAVRAYVFKCGESGKPFVAYMERFTPDALKKLESAKSDPNGGDPMLMENLYATGMEVKKPGGAKWVLRSTADGDKIQSDIKCPDGSTNNIMPLIAGE
jgi:hypothetical protein